MQEFKNYVKLEKVFKLPWNVKYAYLDVYDKDYLADSLLLSHGVENAKFKDYRKSTSDIALIVITFPKKYESNFITVMDELKNKCLLYGHLEYEKACIEFNDGINTVRSGN